MTYREAWPIEMDSEKESTEFELSARPDDDDDDDETLWEF